MMGRPRPLVAFNAVARDFLRFVGGIVEHLNIEQFARIIERGDRFDEALDDVALVIRSEVVR